MQVVDTIQDIEVFIVAQNNELFARVPLNGQLNEDTDAGKPHSHDADVCLSVCLLLWCLCIWNYIWNDMIQFC